MTVCYQHIVYGPSAQDSVPDTTANVVIPYTGKPKLTITPIYGDDGYQVKYYQYEISIAVTIYSAVSVLGDIENEINRIKKILSTPRLQLKIYPTGLGTTPTINGNVGVAGTDFTPDLTLGPLPVSLSVTPAVTNNAIDIEWTVTSCISHCATGSLKNLVQFVSELNMDVDHEGNVSFVQRVTYEAASIITDLNPFNNLMNSFSIQAGASFQGMRQEKSTKLSTDRRTAIFEATYTEIPSDSAFHPFTKNVECTDDMSSALLGDGFYKWNRKISAKITLPPRIHKGWAWVIFKKILKERLRNLEQLDKAAALDALKPGNQNADAAATKNKYLLLKMHITNPIYTRSISFDFEYLITTSLESLMSKSLVLSRVNSGYRPNATTGLVEATSAAVPLSNQWFIWDAVDISATNGLMGYQYEAPISYSQCVLGYEQFPKAPVITPSKLLALENDPDLTLPVSPGSSPGNATAGETIKQNEPSSYAPSVGVDPNYSWVHYDNSFELIQTNDNMQASYLQPVPNAYYRNNNADGGVGRGTIGFQIDNETSNIDSGYYQPETVSRGISTFKIRMKGFAIRAGHRIPIPVLTSVAGNPVERTDVARISHKQIAQSDTTPVYLAMWDILYNVSSNIRSEDIMATMKSTGHPGYYS
jgi:hypothetical protein